MLGLCIIPRCDLLYLELAWVYVFGTGPGSVGASKSLSCPTQGSHYCSLVSMMTFKAAEVSDGTFF